MLKKLIIPSLIVTLAGCDLGIPNLNNPSVDSLTENPTPEGVNAAAVGLIIGHRADRGSATGWLIQTGVYGREALFLSTLADPRYVTELLFSEELTPDGPFGSGLWNYNNIRNANTLLAAVDVVAGMSDEEKEGVRGFAKTIKAMDFFTVIATRNSQGAPIDVERSLEDGLAPFVPTADVYAYIDQLHEEAAVHYGAAGESFSFPMPEGFGGFDTPATFATANRGLQARAAINAGDNQGALDALAGSFMVVDGMNPQLDLGVYHSYGNGAGDTANNMGGNPSVFAHPSLTTGAEAGDDRLAKITAATMTTVMVGDFTVSANQTFTLYPDGTSPIPVIRNEELILLRAEANLNLGNDILALQDVNHIRNESGGLANSLAVTEEDIRADLLYNIRYSLMFEGGHMWLAARRNGVLQDLPNQEGMFFHDELPIPLAEQLARQ